MVSHRFSARLAANLLALTALLLASIGGGAFAQQAQTGVQQAAPGAAQAQPPAAPAHNGAAPAAAPDAQAAPTAAAPPTEPAPAPAPPPAPVLSPADMQAMEEVRLPALNLKTAIETLEKSVERNAENDEELERLRVELTGLMAGAQQTHDSLKPKSDALRQQIEKLGPPPAKDAAPEAEQVANERARLNAMAAEVDGALKTSELVQVRARQLNATVQSTRQSLFAKQILKRTPSPLAPVTWQHLTDDVPGTWRQVTDSLSIWIDSASRKGIELAGLLAGVLVLFIALTALVRRFLSYRLDRPREAPPGFFEQVSAIGWVAPLLALPSLAGIALAAVGLDNLNLLTLEVGQIAKAAFPALVIFVAVSALTRAILSPRRPLWRVVNLSTPAARTLTRIITLIAAVFSADLILQEAIKRLYLPLSISIMETALTSILIAALLLLLVRTPFEPKTSVSGALPHGDGVTAAPPVSRYRPYLIKLPLLAIATAILALSLVGYVGLGRFMTTQVVVTGSAIALVLVFHLAIRAMLEEPGTGTKPLSTVLEERVGLDSDQSTALTRTLSLLLNGALALFALPLILMTWGYSPAEALAWLKAAVFGFEVGDFRISLARILLAVCLFLGLIFLTRLVQRWLDTGILKSRRIDQGIANSIHTAIGYGGFIVAALAAVSYGGLDITNFAIVAGALSVGIGFGLQSIVNNFVSGLILLVERPIKVGDRVAVKGQEGYVRRISVRSTEIETADKASLIVPNSDLITSAVTNWTHRNALGQVVVRVAVSYRSDPDRVREILQKVGAECSLVLQHPPPGVTLDNFGPNGLEFSLAAVIPDVNKAGATQTDLRLGILKAFRAAGIEIAYAQHDIHLRDLDGVKMLLMRLAEERARQASMTVTEPKPKGGGTA